MSGAQRVEAFAPGRVNLIGEHTDYNDGLALPFAIARGVTVAATPAAGDEIHAFARDLGEEDRFRVGVGKPSAGSRGEDGSAEPAAREPGDAWRVEDGSAELAAREPGDAWRAFARGVVAELEAEGVEVGAARLEISADLARGAGLSSSAALSVALSLALLGLAGADAAAGWDEVAGGRPVSGRSPAAPGWDRLRLARLCSRVENEWVGARTGLLDQTASLCGSPGHGLRIDFRDLTVEPVALDLGDWTLVTVDSGTPHVHAGSGYNDRRAECAAACRQLGIASLRDASLDTAAALPEPLRRRVRHVLDENDRVDRTVDALRDGDLATVGRLLDASHASLRDLYDSSTPAVERTVTALRSAGAVGARMMGGGFGGHVLGLLPPGVAPLAGATVVAPAAGARLVRA